MSSTTAEANLRSFNRTDLKRLADVEGGTCVSILLPTHRKGRETQQDPIRFKNLVSDSAKELEEVGADVGLLRSLEDLVANTEFWRHQGNGLAVFLIDDQLELLRLHHSIPEQVHVGKSLLVSPLVREFNSQGECFVLALSWDEAILYRFDGRELTTVETDALPGKFDDLVLPRDPEESLQNTSHRTLGNTGGSSIAMFHGQGEGEDKIEADRRQYLSLVGDEVADAIYNTGLPILLIGTTEVAGHFHASSQVSIDAVIDGSPSQWTDPQLLDQIKQAFRSMVGSQDRDFVQRFGTAMSNDNASKELSEIATAAKRGRVDTLAFTEGKFCADELNDAVRDTICQGGDVIRCEPEAMPDGATIAAICRF